jgi:hypothetical protein
MNIKSCNEYFLSPRSSVGRGSAAIGIAHRPAYFELDVAAVGPPQLPQPLHEGREPGLPFRVVGGESVCGERPSESRDAE